MGTLLLILYCKGRMVYCQVLRRVIQSLSAVGCFVPRLTVKIFVLYSQFHSEQGRSSA